MNDEIDVVKTNETVIPKPESIELKQKESYKPWFISICILLVTLVGLSAYQVFSSYQQDQLSKARALTYQERVDDAEYLLNKQQSVISGLMSDYEEAVYDNPSVTSITQQQFRATEYTLIALQILATQNSQIIQLLATMP